MFCKDSVRPIHFNKCHVLWNGIRFLAITSFSPGYTLLYFSFTTFKVSIICVCPISNMLPGTCSCIHRAAHIGSCWQHVRFQAFAGLPLSGPGNGTLQCIVQIHGVYQFSLPKSFSILLSITLGYPAVPSLMLTASLLALRQQPVQYCAYAPISYVLTFFCYLLQLMNAVSNKIMLFNNWELLLFRKECRAFVNISSRLLKTCIQNVYSSFRQLSTRFDSNQL